MTVQLNLSWWAQAILVAMVGIGVLTGKVVWNQPNSTGDSQPTLVVNTPKPTNAGDPWTAPASGWMAQSTQDR